MTMTRTWFETTLSAKEADVYYKQAVVHFGEDRRKLGEGGLLLLKYMATLNLNIVPDAGTTHEPKCGYKEYPLRVTSVRAIHSVDEYYSRKRQIVSTLDDVPFTDRRVTRRVTVKPMGYAHTSPIPLTKRCDSERSHLFKSPRAVMSKLNHN